MRLAVEARAGAGPTVAQHPHATRRGRRQRSGDGTGAQRLRRQANARPVQRPGTLLLEREPPGVVPQILEFPARRSEESAAAAAPPPAIPARSQPAADAAPVAAPQPQQLQPQQLKPAEPQQAVLQQVQPAAAQQAQAQAQAVRVAVTVPGHRVEYGEHLRLVGSCRELGAWDPAAAPALIWHDGHDWKGEVTLPSGQSLAFKVVVVRGERVVRWERGADRALHVPALPAPAAGAAGAAQPALRVSCRFGDTAGTAVRCQQLEDAEAAARQRVAQLRQQRAELKAQVVSLWEEAQQSEARLQQLRREVEEAVRLELAVAQQAAAAPAGEPGLALAVLGASLEAARERVVDMLLPTAGSGQRSGGLRAGAPAGGAPAGLALAAAAERGGGGGGGGGGKPGAAPAPGLARSRSWERLPQVATFGGAGGGSRVAAAQAAHALPACDAGRPDE